VDIFVSKYALKKGIVIQIVGILCIPEGIRMKSETESSNPVGIMRSGFCHGFQLFWTQLLSWVSKLCLQSV